MSAALAQSAQRGDVTVGNSGKATQTVAQASTAAPVQTAQAGGAAAGVGLGTTLVLVGGAVAAIAVATDDGSTAAVVHH